MLMLMSFLAMLLGSFEPGMPSASESYTMGATNPKPPPPPPTPPAYR